MWMVKKMKYYKIISNGYITSFGDIGIGEEISGEEYSSLLEAISEKPDAPSGYAYLLKTDMTWELVELPPEPVDPDIDDSEALAIILGGAT